MSESGSVTTVWDPAAPGGSTTLGQPPLVPLGVPSAAALARLAGSAIRHPVELGEAAWRFGGEFLSILSGSARRVPDPRDRRFRDERWYDDPLFTRLLQVYLAFGATVDEVLARLGLTGKDARRARFVAGQLVDALAPTNGFLTNPAALRRARDTRGGSIVTGFKHWMSDVRHNGGFPSTVDRRPFEVGVTVGATPGAVVYRDEVCEVIQYRPVTGDVSARPVLIVPPQISRHYVFDLSAGRSLVRHHLEQGLQVFVLSWRNATPDHREWNLDTYVGACMDAIDAVRAVANVADVNLVGVCAGGITTAATLGHLAAIDDSRVHSVTFMVTMLDLDYDTDATLFLSKWSTELAVRNSQRSGVFSGGELSRLFAFLRPNDMVWGFWVNNYLLGHEPPAFDLLAWSADMPNLSAGLHRDFATLALHNPLPRSGALTVRGTPIDLGAVTQDAYVVMALTDHITPWQGCYRTAGLLGGRSRVVLSSSGHMTAVVNPPTTTPSRDSYWVGEDTPTDPHRFQELAEHRTGSWWTDWTNWLVERGGTRKAAPAGLGSDRFPALDAAPGQYVVS